MVPSGSGWQAARTLFPPLRGAILSPAEHPRGDGRVHLFIRAKLAFRESSAAPGEAEQTGVSGWKCFKEQSGERVASEKETSAESGVMPFCDHREPIARSQSFGLRRRRRRWSFTPLNEAPDRD